MTKKMIENIFKSFFIFLTVVGCAAQKREALDHSVNRYLVALRRADFDYAAQWVPMKDRTEFLKNSLGLKNYTISNVELERVDTPKETLAEMVFLIELYSNNDSEVKTFRRKILWNYDDKTRSWEAMAKGPMGASSSN